MGHSSAADVCPKCTHLEYLHTALHVCAYPRWGDLAAVLQREGGLLHSSPARVQHEALGWGAPEHWAALSQQPQWMLWTHLIEGFVDTVNAWLVVTWLGGVDWSCSTTAITMRFLEKDCLLHASGLRMPCSAHQAFCFTPREVKRIPFPVLQGSIEIAADECKVLSACCHVHAVI